MPYFTDLNTYLHQSSLLIQAYPTTRITTKYSLPRKPNTRAKGTSKPKGEETHIAPPAMGDATAPTPSQRSKRDPSAFLTLKTFHPESGICLKYRTDKAAEVGRLLNGLGRLAKGEVMEMLTSTVAATVGEGDKMDVDSGAGAETVRVEEKIVTSTPAANQAGGGGGGKGKKKKGKK